MYWIRRKRSNKCVCNKAIYLDIETSNNHDEANLKTWIVSIQVRFDGKYYLFRTPMQLIHFLKSLIKDYNLNPLRRVVCMIHNASYDLSYLVPFLQRFLPKEPRSGIYEGLSKIISYSQYCFDFYCTYQLTNMSLAKWSKEMNVEHQKQVGLYDYSKIIYQDDELSDQELLYDEFDVLSLEECHLKQMELHHDDIASSPLTSTGYCRREFRQTATKDKEYMKAFRDNRISLELYNYSLNAYAGGYVHNNKNFGSEIVLADIGHNDFRSHYPSICMSRMLPFGEWELMFDIGHEFYRQLYPTLTIEHLEEMYPEYTCLARVVIYKACLKEDIPFPFMQDSKLRNKSEGWTAFKDNGRILKIKRGTCEIYADTLTLKILRKQYNLAYTIVKVFKIKNTRIPKCLGKTINKLFKDKSDYKKLHKECEKDYGLFASVTLDAAFHLGLSKMLLNSTYGMLSTRLILPDYDMDYDHYDKNGNLDPMINLSVDADPNEQLDKYYNGRNNFLPYIGYAVTSAARYELWEFAEAIGYNNCLYMDTDSIFYFKSDEIADRIKELNALHHKTAPYITDNYGERIYYDVFEPEKDIVAFKGLHSKCYGYITEDDELVATIAGVPARTLIGKCDDKLIYLTREEELAGITAEMKLADPDIQIEDKLAALDNLKIGAKFKTNTGTTSNYIVDKPHIEIINGHRTQLAGGCVITKLKEKQIKDFTIDKIDKIEDYPDENQD